MAESNLPTTGEELDVKNEFLDTGEKKQQGKTWLWWFLTVCLLSTSHHQLFSPFQEPEPVSNFACIQKQGAGCIWDWTYPLTNVSNVIRDAMRKSIRSRQILLHIKQAILSYNAVSSLKKLKYS